MNSDKTSDRDITAQDMRVDGAGGRLFVRRWSTGGAEGAGLPPVILLHDSLGCVELWRDFPARLAGATGRTVVAYDRLGFGRSDPHPGRLDLTFVRDEARGAFSTLCARLGIGDFVVFGHSVGGGMAVGVAGAFPERCRALVTVSAQAFVEDRTTEGIREAKRGFDQPGQMDRLRRYHGEKAQWVLDAWVETWLSPQFASWTLDGDLPAVRCPALIIHGDQDEYGSTSHPERLAALTAGPATVGILPGCGHVPHREAAPAVIDMVARFLRREAR
ncbi:alpha/beta fold hydrolase [Azospirillum thermophilum]|uniref:Alpha/beta hydrolase n=1 Tax=Azospirillum thermophilum TaxID=2202148 RepID=A0A2S2CMB9_9PROT|nr:alpha/beta hydrolase [Azospirillum thermophilum]AWK85569.1 alpha/beta hydrolase [Azospirillum thermophilum]